MIILKSNDEISKIRSSCEIVAEILSAMEEWIQPGVSTEELDRMAEEMMLKRGSKPAFKGYKGYPKSICASINDVVVHGIPNATKLRDGDIISVDIGVIREGFFGDSARTFAVGKIDSSAKQLLQVTQEALQLSIEKANKNNHLQDISAAVQRHVEKFGFSIVRDFVGHGIGRDLHEDPPIPNFGMPGYGPKLEVGMVLAIEPMVNEGKPEVKIDKDGWTARTKDGKRSAHFEHSVAITESGPVILSKVA
jgi:methionyl aminopeptidase